MQAGGKGDKDVMAVSGRNQAVRRCIISGLDNRLLLGEIRVGKKFILMLAALVLATGCTSMGRVAGDIAAPSAQESVFVLGLAPENYRVMIFPGSIKNGVFTQNPWLPAAFYGATDGGYIVGQAKAGTVLAITMVRVVEGEKSILGADFTPCNQAKTVVFEAQPGKVAYLGNVLYQWSGSQLQVRYWKDLAAARSYLSGKYAGLATSLQEGSFQLLPTSASCSTSITVPVYVPR